MKLLFAFIFLLIGVIVVAQSDTASISTADKTQIFIDKLKISATPE